MKKYNITCEPVAEYRLAKSKIKDSAGSAWVASEIFRIEKLQILVKEYAVAILVNKSNSVVGHLVLSEGGTDATIIDPKLVGKAICDTLAQGVILVHNHPSGQLSASAQDIRVTQKIEKVCAVFDVRLLDHIILTDGGYYSLRDNDLI